MLISLTIGGFSYQSGSQMSRVNSVSVMKLIGKPQCPQHTYAALGLLSPDLCTILFLCCRLHEKLSRQGRVLGSCLDVMAEEKKR